MGTELLNWQDGVARVVNNRALYAKLLGRFADSQGGAADAIEAALAAGNTEEARQLTHTLKGTAANLGGEALADAALHLEEAIKNGQDVAAVLGVVRQSLQDTLAAMKAFQA